MGPACFKKTKAKRSCVRLRRMQLRPPGDYHKVKLRTASGGSLTIRYRKSPSLTPRSCSSGESFSGDSEASSCGHSCDQSLTANSLEENKAFENLEDLLEYSQSCISGIPADGCDAVYKEDMQQNFTSYNFWPSDDCNSSDIGSNEVLPEFIAADSISIPVSTPIVVNESFLEDLTETNPNTFEDTQCFSQLEQSAMLIQQLKSFSYQGLEVTSTLVCMQSFEHQLADTSLWSIDPENHTSNITEASRLMENRCNFSFTSHLPLFDETESSEIELINLPLLCDETAATMCAQESSLHERYEIRNESLVASSNSVKEEAEIFDENSFLCLDPSMPDEVNLNMNFSASQSPWIALLDQNTLQETAEQAAPAQKKWTAATAVAKSNAARSEHVEKALSEKLSTQSHYMPAWEDNIPARKHEVTLPGAATNFIDHDSSILSDPVAARVKKLRKKRLRRATPLNTLRSLLSRRDESSPLDMHQRQTLSPARETNSQDLHDDTVCQVTKRSSNMTSTERLAESSMFSELGSMGRIAHPEKFISKSVNNIPHQVSCTVNETHNSLSDNVFKRKSWSLCTTGSEDEIDNQASVIASSSQRSHQGRSVFVPRKQSNTVSGKSVRRVDGRSRPKTSFLLPERAVAILRNWFDDHISFPFADKEQKLELVSQTGLTLTQVENWLSNYRHRLKVKRSDYEGNVFCPEKAGPRRH